MENRMEAGVVVSITSRIQYRPQNSMFLIMGTPKIGTKLYPQFWRLPSGLVLAKLNL